MKRDKRLGRFEVDQVEVEAMAPGIRRVMREVIVISVRHSLVCGRFEYMALSDLFRPVALGEIAPLYQFTLEEGGSIKAREVTE